MTTPDLLSPTDFAKFNAKDQTWFLQTAGSVVRERCGWHIAPNLARTGVICQVGNAGVIMLPSLHVTSVQAVRVNGITIAATDYTVHQSGWLHWHRMSCAPYMNPGVKRVASVDFTHGFTTLPKTVAEVGHELAATALEKAAGIVTDITRGPTRYKFKEFGFVLSDDQKDRLAPFTLLMG